MRCGSEGKTGGGKAPGRGAVAPRPTASAAAARFRAAVTMAAAPPISAVLAAAAVAAVLGLPGPSAAQEADDAADTLSVEEALEARNAPPAAGSCVVRRVIDGDTFVCRDGERVRLLLVNTPEMDREPYGRLAREALLEMIPPGTRVRLETDVEERDVYGRLLAHVHAPSGTWVNRELARRGYAQVMVIPPNVRRVEEIRAAARRAREEGAGFWDAGVLEGSGDGAAGDGEGSCHPSYPGVCLPPPPPDLDCADIFARAFRVQGADPHRLDGNGDGLACEGS